MTHLYASIFNAAKSTGFKHELILHRTPAISGDSAVMQMYFATKSQAKAAAKAVNAKPYNY